MASVWEQLDRARRFVVDGDLWRVEIRAGTFAAIGLRALQLITMLGQAFVRDQILLRASGLTYMTLLSVIPLLAVSFSIVSAVGVSENLIGYVADLMAAGSPTAREYIVQFVEKADIRGLGTLGAGILVITTVLALRQVEETFNEIWGVQQSRGWMRRFADYLAVLVVAPMLAGMAVSLGTTLESEPLVHKLLENPIFHRLYDSGLVQMPRVFLAMAFTFLYWFFPNTQVKLGYALIGGVVAAFLFSGAQGLYVAFNIGAARASALFGGMSALPLFMAWNYLSWVIVLAGCVLACALQNFSHFRREVRGGLEGAAERETGGLRIAVEIARAFRDGDTPHTAVDLADHLDLSGRTARDILRRFEAQRIVSPCRPDDRDLAYQLARPADQIRVSDVFLALRGERRPSENESAIDPNDAVASLLSRVDDAAGAITESHTLADVLSAGDGVPPQ